MIHFGADVAVSAAATAVAVVLLVLAVRRLAAVIVRGRAAALRPKRLPMWAAGWLGLVAFAAGIALGRAFWP